MTTKHNTTSHMNAVPLPRRNFSRIVAGIGLVLGLVLVAILIRVNFAPRAEPNDPLHGGSEEAVPALADALKPLAPKARLATLKRYATDESPGLRFAAVEQLGEQHRGPEVATILANAYTDSSSIVRQRVLETLPDVDRERGLRLLLAGLRDEDSWMRDAAVTQLKSRARAEKSLVDFRAVPSLIATLDDGSPFVASTAVSVLRQISGKPWHYKTFAPATEKSVVNDHWKAWWSTERGANPSHSGDGFATPIPPVRPKRSDPAPSFRLHDIDGHAVSSEAQRSRVTLLNFWGTWCPPCQKEIPDLVRLDKEYRSRGVDVVGIAVGERDGAEGLRKWCAAHGVSYHQVLAVESLQHDYGDIHEVPVTILIDRKGSIRRRWEGERDFETFRTAVDDVLQK